MASLGESSTAARDIAARRLSGAFRPAGGADKEKKFGFIKVGEDEYFVLPSECHHQCLPSEGVRVSFVPGLDAKGRKRARSVREAENDVVVLSSSEGEDDHSKAREDPYEKAASSGEEEKMKKWKKVKSWPLTQNVLERVAEVTNHSVEAVAAIENALKEAQEEKEATLAYQKVLEEQEKTAEEKEEEKDESPRYVKPVSKKRPRP